MMSHCAKHCTFDHHSTVRPCQSKFLSPLLTPRGRAALPVSTKPFRSHIRSIRASRRIQAPRAALSFSSIPQQALIAGGAGEASALQISYWEYSPRARPNARCKMLSLAFGKGDMSTFLLTRTGTDAVVALGVGTLVWGLTQQAQKLNSMTEYDASTGSLVSELPPRENAVLVFGSTGKLGRQVVLQVWQPL